MSHEDISRTKTEVSHYSAAAAHEALPHLFPCGRDSLRATGNSLGNTTHKGTKKAHRQIVLMISAPLALPINKYQLLRLKKKDSQLIITKL